MESAEVDSKSISKDNESPESDQPQPKESDTTKIKGQAKCGCDGPSTVKTRTSREEKLKKKDDKSVEHVLKALNSLNTTEEKLAAMCKKYADIFDENRKLQLALKQSEKRNGVLQREKEQLQTDQSKSILTRSRLENLCRELQRQNKAIKDESLSKIREEEEKRKEVSTKFQSALAEINHLMQQNTDKNSKLRDDNLDMNARLKSVCEQYELREQEVDRISKQMQLESQLAEAKLAKAKMEMAAERELFIREKQQLLVEITQYQARCQEFQTNEINLRKQISLYNEKYDEFQKALAKSNEVFGGFKVEMDKMSKKILKLEKETITWKQRWENSHQALLNMADDKQKTDAELGLVNRQLGALQGLCRTLQSERTAMIAKLKDAGIKNEEETPLLANGDNESSPFVSKQQDTPTTDNQQNKCLKKKSSPSVDGQRPNSSDAVVSSANEADASSDGGASKMAPVTSLPLSDSAISSQLQQNMVSGDSSVETQSNGRPKTEPALETKQAKSKANACKKASSSARVTSSPSRGDTADAAEACSGVSKPLSPEAAKKETVKRCQSPVAEAMAAQQTATSSKAVNGDAAKKAKESKKKKK